MEIEQYDPLEPPDPAQWLATDEDQRIERALEYHTRAGVSPPNAEVHATLHAIVENQIALGDETPVRLKVRQLMAQGLDRHEAIHAVSWVLINYIVEMMRDPTAAAAADNPNARYHAALRRLSAKKWLRSG